MIHENASEYGVYEMANILSRGGELLMCHKWPMTASLIATTWRDVDY